MPCLGLDSNQPTRLATNLTRNCHQYHISNNYYTACRSHPVHPTRALIMEEL